MTLKPLLKFSTTLIVSELMSITEHFVLEKYSWFVVPDHCWPLQKHPTSGRQMNLNPRYHPSPGGMTVKLKAKSKPKRGETK